MLVYFKLTTAQQKRAERLMFDVNEKTSKHYDDDYCWGGNLIGFVNIEKNPDFALIGCPYFDLDKSVLKYTGSRKFLKHNLVKEFLHIICNNDLKSLHVLTYDDHNTKIKWYEGNAQ